MKKITPYLVAFCVMLAVAAALFGFTLLEQHIVAYRIAKAAQVEKARQDALAEAKLKAMEENRRMQEEREREYQERAAKERQAQMLAELASSRHSLAGVAAALYQAQTNYSAVYAGAMFFTTNRPYLTNAVYRQIQKQLNSDVGMYNSLTESANSAYDQASSEARLNQRHGPSFMQSVVVYGQAQNQALGALHQTGPVLERIRAERQQLADIVEEGAQFWNDKVTAAQQALDNAQRDYASISNRINELSAYESSR